MSQQQSIAFFEKLTAAIIRFRWAALAGVLLLTAFFLTQAANLKFNGSFEIWFFEDDPAMQRLRAFKEAFGNDQFVYILAETDGVFTPDAAAKLKRLAQELESRVPFLRDLNWVGNAEHITAKDDAVAIRKLLDDIPTDRRELDRRLGLALSEKDFVDRYISKDGKAAGILIELERFPEGHMVPPPSEQVARAVLAVTGMPEFSDMRLHVVGDPIFETRYNDVANSETPKFFGLCLLVQAVLFYLFTRTIRGVLLPLAIVTLSFIWTLGVINVIGFDLDLMVVGLPVLLITICINDIVHPIIDFNHLTAAGLSRKDALVHAMGQVGLASFLTCLTTAIGFFSFGRAPIKPFMNMSLYLPAGVMLAYLLTLVLIPAIYSFGRKPPAPMAGRGTRSFLPDRFFDWLHRLIVGHPRLIVAGFTGCMVLGLIGTLLVEVESNLTKYLTKNVPLRQDVDYVDSRMGGSTGLEIIIDTKRPDGVKDLTVLDGMERLAEALETDPLVHKTFSIVDVLRKMRRAMHGDDPAYYSLPDKQSAIPEYLALYEASGGDQMDRIVNFDNSKARINLQTQALGSRETRLLIEKTDVLSRSLFGDGVVVATTGFMDIAKTLNDNMGTAQVQSILLAFGTIAVVMTVTLGSVRMGLISMLPNVFPIVIVLGLLGFTGIYMDTILMTISAMGLGVSMDDTIHYFLRVRREFDRTGNYADAIGNALHAVGRHMVFSSVVLILGLLVLTNSVLTGWIKIGALSAVAFTWGIWADLLFSPALLLLLKPLGPERAPNP